MKRHEIAKALRLKRGMAVADVGAGTGLFTRLFAELVGPEGKVYAVDISKEFLDYIAAQAKAKGQAQVVTVRGTQDSTNLPAGSVDLVFLCDVYHHLEDHEKVLSSIHRALRPGGSLVLVEFDRIEGKSSDFVLKHIRAGQAEFRREIESAGFESVDTPPGPKLRENFFARFTRRAEGPMAVRSGRRTAGERGERTIEQRVGPPFNQKVHARDDRQRCGKPSGSPSVSSRGRRVQSRQQDGLVTTLKLMPYLDERLGLGVTPGQAGFFQIVGTPAPLLTARDRPVRNHAPISQRVEDRDDRLGCSRCAWAGDIARRFQRPAKSGTPGRRLDLVVSRRPPPRPPSRWRAFPGHSERVTRSGPASGSEAHAREKPPNSCVI